jgi:hypothetical protein
LAIINRKNGIVFVVAFWGLVAQAQVVIYEGSTFPKDEGWERIVFTDVSRSLIGGFLVQYVDEPNEVDSYRKLLHDFAGVSGFFIEWRVESDAPKSILDRSGVPVVLVAGGKSAAFYHTTITDSRVQLFRDTSIPLVFIDIEPNVAHTYRLELSGDQSYAWYVDARVVESGVPHGTYPNADSRITWGTRRQRFDSTTRWDYVRYGVIPQDASGDFDTSASVDLSDFYFFHECLTNERVGIRGGPDEQAGPGCRWADFEGDADVDLHDVAAFQNLFDGGQ